MAPHRGAMIFFLRVPFFPVSRGTCCVIAPMETQVYAVWKEATENSAGAEE